MFSKMSVHDKLISLYIEFGSGSGSGLGSSLKGVIFFLITDFITNNMHGWTQHQVRVRVWCWVLFRGCDFIFFFHLITNHMYEMFCFRYYHWLISIIMTIPYRHTSYPRPPLYLIDQSTLFASFTYLLLL